MSYVDGVDKLINLCYKGGVGLKKDNFCCVDNFSVIIPYRELEKMLQSANKIEHIETLVKRVDERCAAMHLMYSEILEKVAEIYRFL